MLIYGIKTEERAHQIAANTTKNGGWVALYKLNKKESFFIESNQRPARTCNDATLIAEYEHGQKFNYNENII